jgi:hypothetical protein
MGVRAGGVSLGKKSMELRGRRLRHARVMTSEKTSRLPHDDDSPSSLLSILVLILKNNPGVLDDPN